jgi:Ca2+-binding EF-hand superfamily protein
VKELLKYTDENKDGFIQHSEFEQFLDNIGAGEKLTKDEIEEVMEHVGGSSASDNKISIETVQKVLIDDIIAKKKK